MSADVADAKTNETKPKRGGPRGERPWRDKPTARERVMNQSLAEAIKEVTGRDVSPETIRAVRFTITKWSTSDEVKKLRENMDKKLAKAKLQDKREKALEQLREAESELSKYDDPEGDEDEDEDEEDEISYEDESDDESEDDPFGSDEKVSESFG